MSQVIDPSEVLTYLNELGYTNINAQQLKEFITDLKKLMKYDQRKYNNNRKKNVENTPNENDCLPKKGNNCYICDSNEANIFNTLYSQSTIASKAKEVVPQKREKHISVHISKSAGGRVNTHIEHCIHSEKQQGDNETNQVKSQEEKPLLPSDSQGSKVTIKTETTIKSVRPITSDSSISKKSKVSSFIRPSISKPVNKSDPVALYHHYQSQWKKQKIPGQDNRSDLRWAIRERMMVGPKIEVNTIPIRSRCNSYR